MIPPRLKHVLRSLQYPPRLKQTLSSGVFKTPEQRRILNYDDSSPVQYTLIVLIEGNLPLPQMVGLDMAPGQGLRGKQIEQAADREYLQIRLGQQFGTNELENAIMSDSQQIRRFLPLSISHGSIWGDFKSLPGLAFKVDGWAIVVTMEGEIPVCWLPEGGTRNRMK